MTSTTRSTANLDETIGLSSRIARFDEFYDPKRRTTVHRKSNRARPVVKDDKKHDDTCPTLVVRRVLNMRGEHTTTEVDVKSQKLADVMRKLYKGFEGMSISRDPPRCNSKVFALSRNALKCRLDLERAATVPDNDLIRDLEIALVFIAEDHGSTLADVHSTLSGDEPSIPFDLLWLLFAPGTLLYSHEANTEQDRILQARTYETANSQEIGLHAHIVTHIVSFDGKKLGPAEVIFQIPHYVGTRNIEDLPVYPLELHPNREAIERSAAERGRKFVRLLGYTFHEVADGPAVGFSPQGEVQVFNVCGRVMVDPMAYRQNIGWGSINPPVSSRLDASQLTEEQFMLCTPIVLGFSFVTKRWGGFALDRLCDIVWSSQPFKSLVLSPKTKDLVHSMVRQHSDGLSDFDDIVQGKGKGLVGLLCGPPGCGKTLTAEAVAEVTKCPLYCLSAGELGTSSSDVEESLSEALELAQRWRCVVLLDEADVFLSQRTCSDLQRNALVSIFLRKLEYYQGILILTTNMITQCDVAFESRIHFTINYPSLSSESQRQIWRTFISKTSGRDAITDAEIKALSKLSLNGRQIKNTVAVAQSFASGAGTPLSLDHIHTVLEVMRDWQKAKGSAMSDPSGYIGGAPHMSPMIGGGFGVATVIVSFLLGLVIAGLTPVLLWARQSEISSIL